MCFCMRVSYSLELCRTNSSILSPLLAARMHPQGDRSLAHVSAAPGGMDVTGLRGDPTGKSELFQLLGAPCCGEGGGGSEQTCLTTFLTQDLKVEIRLTLHKCQAGTGAQQPKLRFL